MTHPGGRNSHRLINSGRVMASQTSRRGALNRRVIRISVSDGVEIVRVSGIVAPSVFEPRIANWGRHIARFSVPRDAGAAPMLERAGVATPRSTPGHRPAA